MEFLRSTNNNSWGVGFSEEWTSCFLARPPTAAPASTCRSCEPILRVGPRHAAPSKSCRTWPTRNLPSLFPITENVRQVDWHGGFTGRGRLGRLYTGAHLPEVLLEQDLAFVAEPTSHLVPTFTLHPDGTDFHSHNAWNLVASDDEWTSPILADVGPDGQVWVIDWYNFIVQHNPTPKGYKTGKGSAYETPLRDKTHGRIYRIVARDGKPSEQPRLSKGDPKGLVAALTNDNMFWRLHAQRLLVERGDRSIKRDLALLIDGPADATGLNAAGVHAIWALQGLGLLEVDGPAGAAPRGDEVLAVVMRGLKHPSPGVRRAAILALPRHPGVAPGLLDSGVFEDTDPQVRLAACLAMSEIPRTGDVHDASRIVSALLDPRNQQDRWMGDALTIAAAAHAPEFFQALGRRGPGGTDERLLIPVTARVAEHYARGGPVDSITSVLALQRDMKPAVRDALIGGLAKGWPRDKTPAQGADAERAIGGLLPALSPEARGQMLGLASRWGAKGLEPFVAGLARDFFAAAADESKPEAARIPAARQLIDLRKSDPRAARDVIALITAKTPPDLASGLIGAVARSDSPEVGTALVDAIGAMTPAARKASILALLQKTDWTGALVSAIEQGKVALSLLSLDQSQALAAHPDSRIAERAKALLAKGGGLPDPDRERVIQALAPLVMKGGNGLRGREIFKKECLKCHMHSGEGGKVGPDLTGMAAHPRSEPSIVHILDPSRSVEGNYLQYTVSTTDGRVLSGLLAGETKTSGSTCSTPREEADDPPRRRASSLLAASKKSVMPGGVRGEVGPARGPGRPAPVPHAEGEVPAAGRRSARSQRSPRLRGCLSGPGGRLVG